MRTIIQNALLLLLLAIPLLSSGQVLRGIVSGDDGSIPNNTKVFILGVGESDIDANGAYSISLSRCTGCDVGAEITVNVNSDYGAAREDYTIPKNLSMSSFDIEVPRSNMIVITGTVKDRDSGRYIRGIKVTPVIPNSPLKIGPVDTDNTGIFRFVINKRGVGSSQAIQLIFTDPINGKYKETEKIVFTNQYAPLIIELENCEECGLIRKNIKVDGYRKTSILVKAGEMVEIKATGSMKVGSIVGNSSPRGRESGAFGMSLIPYNIISNFNHAALMYRFGAKDPWIVYDPTIENLYLVQDDGYLEVEINDNTQSDNTGHYDVEVIVKK